MNALELSLNKFSPLLFASYAQTKVEVNHLLQKYATNFPEYTDHSLNHTFEVAQIAAELLTYEEIQRLNQDEVYILSMGCILHDIGMCIPEEKIQDLLKSNVLLDHRKAHPTLSQQDAIRDVHHTISKNFINTEWELLKIPSKKYAHAIGLLAEGHRKVDLGNFEVYDHQFFAKSGRDSVCLPYLSCILRIADELDVTNSRVPKLLAKYYMPNNEISIREWQKHILTSQRNYKDNKVIFEVDCSDQNIYAAFQDQFEKIQGVINYCQKVIRSIPPIRDRFFGLGLTIVEPKYTFIGFDPKGIRFSFDVQNVVTAFIGEDLYNDKLASLREAVQNSIDSCRYKSSVLKEHYKPSIKIVLDAAFISIEDNGAGMDEFIIENFFGRLGSSFYEQDKIKDQFEAIGQFGVGVFSYFLISEYVDIETKTASSNPLKFRFDKDPKSYFHFYDDANQHQPGTKITMNLKSEFRKIYSDEAILDYLKNIFRHIDVPIVVEIGGHAISLIDPGFHLDSKKEIRQRLRLRNKHLVDDLEMITVEIRNEEIEGVCGLIVGNISSNIFEVEKYLFDLEQFHTVARRSHSQISISQKGVFVNDYSSPVLNLMVGDINIKKKIGINIDRNEFKDRNQIEKIIDLFDIELLEKILGSLDYASFSGETKLKITSNLLEKYFSSTASRLRFLDSERYLQLLGSHIYVRYFDGEDEQIVSVNFLVNSIPIFILLSDNEDHVNIYKELKLPIVIVPGYMYIGIFDNVLDILHSLFGFSREVSILGNKMYLQIAKEIRESDEYGHKVFDTLIDNYYDELAYSDSPDFFLDIWKNKEFVAQHFRGERVLVNSNHFLSRFIINNFERIKENQEFVLILNEVYIFILDILHDNTNISTNVVKLNEMLDPLKKIEFFPIFSAEDFRNSTQ